ncbi:MAG: alpha/beta fold hydrolase [Dehalococcoidia bacterium]
MTTTELTEEATSRFVQAGSIRMHYNEAGTGGPPLVCIHGGGPGASGWSNFRQNLPALSAIRRTLLVDMPQYGKSEAVVVNEPRLGYNARNLKAMLDALDIDKVTLIGNSMGGGTSVKFAIDYPDRVDRLVLMGSAGFGPSLFTPQPTEGIKFLGNFYRNPTREAMKNIIDVFVYDSSFMTEELLEQRYQAAMDPAIMEARKNSNTPYEDLTADLRKIKAQTLIIWGADDRFVPLDQGLGFLRHIPDARLVVLPRCGHWAQYEHADEFDRLVIDFLSH